MDKRGQIGINFGLGSPLIFGIITLILVLAIIFSSTFRIIALAIGLMTMAFFIVTKKGVRRNVKMPIFFILITVGLVLFFASGVLQSTFNQPSSVFIDKELGMVVTTTESAITQAIFKSTSGSGISVSNVGEKVKICDYFLTADGYKYTKYDWVTKLNGNIISTTGITGNANSQTSYCREWTPTKAGKYEVVSKSTFCPDVYGPVRPSDCISRSSDDVKSYYLEVKPVSEKCSKSPYIGSWYISKNIENGKVMASNVYKVTNDCNYAVNYKNTMTICNDGALIENSNLQQTEGDNWKCVVETVEEDVTIDPECNVDLIVSCGDGTSILSKTCSNGLYSDTGIECAVVGEPEDGNMDDTTDGNTNDNNIPNIEDDKNFMQDYGKWVVGGLIGLVVLVLIIIGVKRK